jgi:hypothetical protein
MGGMSASDDAAPEGGFWGLAEDPEISAGLRGAAETIRGFTPGPWVPVSDTATDGFTTTGQPLAFVFTFEEGWRDRVVALVDLANAALDNGPRIIPPLPPVSGIASSNT